jgi:hypothetical protein
MQKSILPNNAFEWYWFWRGSIAVTIVWLVIFLALHALGAF